MQEDLVTRRLQMVERWLDSRALSDARVFGAMGATPRELFVPEELQAYAYEDVALPIGYGQTISQPYIVARMMEALELSGDERVLEIGTGSGYAAAVLSRLAREVHTVERIEALANAAIPRLTAAGCTNVSVHIADGSRGWPDAAPYEAIVVAASSPRLPRELLDQLTEGGRFVMPVGEESGQVLVRVRRIQGRFVHEDLEMVRFVPLVDAGNGSP